MCGVSLEVLNVNISLVSRRNSHEPILEVSFISANSAGGTSLMDAIKLQHIFQVQT